MKRPTAIELLNRTITTSTSLVWEPAHWASLAMAEVKAKLLTQEQKEAMRKLAQRIYGK